MASLNLWKDSREKLLGKLFLPLIAISCGGFVWGFFAHQRINRYAVFTLPPAMIGFYKKHIDYLAEASVAPDRRRYVVADEAPKHYIDLDRYGENALATIPHAWSEAVKKFGEDTLNAKGVVPWQINQMYYRLKDAFLLYDPEKILRTSAELGHYVADAHVPLHTTSNYDGQLTKQSGLHAFWESRLPELFFSGYDLLVGKATYIEHVQQAAWETVAQAHTAVDSVLNLEKKLADRTGNKKYNFETRGRQTIKVVSFNYASSYHEAMNGMVERQLRASIKMVGDLWYSAWVDAGQPDLKRLIDYTPTEEELKQRKQTWENLNIRQHGLRPHESERN